MNTDILMYILFFVGLILIIKGGDWFVDSAAQIAETLGVPKFIIGATIVSAATTLPEMLVSVQATLKGNVDMAAGNAIGSVTANTAVIMGIFIVCMPSKIKRGEFAPKGLMMLAAAAALIIGCVLTPTSTMTFESETSEYYTLSAWGAAALAVIFAVFFCENIVGAKKIMQRHGSADPSVTSKMSGRDRAKNIFVFILGAAGIIFGADLLVDYGTVIALSLGIPQRVISVIGIAFGTSLPELVTTVTALRKKNGALSVGNILGANIIDLTLILPVCSAVSLLGGTGALAVSVSSVTVDMAVCLAAVAVVVLPTVVTKKKFSRAQGVLLLAGYAAYVLTVLV